MAFWERTKTNRLKLPKRYRQNLDHASGTNRYDQPNALVGDFVWLGSAVSAGTVGKLIGVDNTMTCYGGGVATVEMLSGEQKINWIAFSFVLDYSAVQEVKDFYITDGRPDRIKVAW